MKRTVNALATKMMHCLQEAQNNTAQLSADSPSDSNMRLTTVGNKSQERIAMVMLGCFSRPGNRPEIPEIIKNESY
jgi:predicted NACHT family NTPase